MNVFKPTKELNMQQRKWKGKQFPKLSISLDLHESAYNLIWNSFGN